MFDNIKLQYPLTIEYQLLLEQYWNKAVQARLSLLDLKSLYEKLEKDIKTLSE